MIYALLVSTGCGQVASQSQNASNDDDKTPAKVIPKEASAVKSNSEYQLSVVFRPFENEAGKLYYEYIIRDDKTKREFPVNFYEYPLRVPAEKAGEVWSPDAEYLVLNCGSFCVYKTSDLAKALKKSKNFQAERFAGKTDVVTDKGNSEYEQEFGRWDTNDSFVFKAIRVKYNREADEKYEPQEYRYNIVERKLTCLSKFCGFTRDRNGKIKKIGKN